MDHVEQFQRGAARALRADFPFLNGLGAGVYGTSGHARSASSFSTSGKQDPAVYPMSLNAPEPSFVFALNNLHKINAQKLNGVLSAINARAGPLLRKVNGSVLNAGVCQRHHVRALFAFRKSRINERNRRSYRRQ